MAKKEKELNNDTPLWFRLWHAEHFLSYARTTKRNEKWIFIIIIAIIGSGVLANGKSEAIVSLFEKMLGA